MLRRSALTDQLVASDLSSTAAGVRQGLLFLAALYAGNLLLALFEILIWIDWVCPAADQSRVVVYS